MEDCIFCKIVKGEIPSYKVYEDDNVLAFLDNYPLVVGHTLIVPKKHKQWVWDIEEEDYLKLMKSARLIAKAIKETFKVDFVSEGIIGIDIPHAHIHLIPRNIGDNLGSFPSEAISPKPTKEEFHQIAEKIKSNI